MKKLLKPILLPALFLTIISAPWRTIEAMEQVSPAVVISIAPIDEQFADAAYIAKAMQAPFEVQLAIGFGKAMIPQGIDTSKPMGGYVTIDADETVQQAFFLAVTDLDKVLKALKKFLPDHENLGDGLTQVTSANGDSFYLKQQGNWVFVADKKSNLANLPKNPAELLGNLPKQYNIAVEIKAANVPQDLKDTLIGAMQAGFDDARDRIKERNPDAAPLVDQYGPAFLEAMEQFFSQADSLMYGIGIDATDRNAHLDVSITGRPGTELAKELEGSSIKSRFGGFGSSKASASLNLATKMAAADIQMSKDILTGLREKALEDADDKFQKEVIGTVFDVLLRTADSGKLDAGASLFTGDGPGTVTVALGAAVADGAALDKVLRQIIAKAPEGGPRVRVEADMHGDVVFHTTTIKISERNQRARDILGAATELTVGLGKDSLYVAAGNDTIATLKKAIDESKANQDNSSPPMQLTVAAQPILNTAASIKGDDDLRALADSLDNFAGNDRLSLSLSTIDRGARFRLEFEEGAIFVIGQVVQKIIQEQGPGFPGLPPGALGN